jgi:hypothetical protein
MPPTSALVIDHREEDFFDAVERAVGPNAVNVIVDFVQGQPGQRARPLLHVEGRHVLAGHAAGLLPIHPNEFYLQNWTLVGVCMGSGYGLDTLRVEAEAHAALLALLGRGAYSPSVSRVIGCCGTWRSRFASDSAVPRGDRGPEPELLDVQVDDQFITSVITRPRVPLGCRTPSRAAIVGATSTVSTRRPMRPGSMPGPIQITGTCES